FFFSSRRRHTRFSRDWSSDVCSSDLHVLPETFDAQGRNSLDLAPTVLQLAGVQSRRNAFLGASLFEERRLPLGIAALGAKYFLKIRRASCRESKDNHVVGYLINRKAV